MAMPRRMLSVTPCAWSSRTCPTSATTTPSTSRTTDMAVIQRDVDPQETREWLEALEAVPPEERPGRAQQLSAPGRNEARGAGAPGDGGPAPPLAHPGPPPPAQRPPGD